MFSSFDIFLGHRYQLGSEALKGFIIAKIIHTVGQNNKSLNCAKIKKKTHTPYIHMKFDKPNSVLAGMLA